MSCQRAYYPLIGFTDSNYTRLQQLPQVCWSLPHNLSWFQLQLQQGHLLLLHLDPPSLAAVSNQPRVDAIISSGQLRTLSRNCWLLYIYLYQRNIFSFFQQKNVMRDSLLFFDLAPLKLLLLNYKVRASYLVDCRKYRIFIIIQGIFFLSQFNWILKTD